MSIDTTDGSNEKGAIEEMRELTDTLEIVAEGDYPGTDAARKILTALEEVDD